MDLQHLIKQHKELSKKIEEMEEQKRALGAAIMQQMNNKTLQVPGYFVRLCNRLSIKLTIDEARYLNAVKMEEVVDKDKIKDLYNSGKPINGVSEIRYIQIVEQPH